MLTFISLNFSILYSAHDIAAAAVFLSVQVAQRNPKLLWRSLQVDLIKLTKSSNGQRISINCIKDICAMTLKLSRFLNNKWLMADGGQSVLLAGLTEQQCMQDTGTQELRQACNGQITEIVEKKR